MPEIRDDSKNVFRDLVIQEEFDQLKVYMAQLGETCKQVLLDVFFYKYKMQEVAKRAGLASAKIASDRKYKCLQKLRKLLSQVKTEGFTDPDYKL